MQKNAGEASEIAAHEREIAAANARAYRELERAAAANGGLESKDPIDAAWARQGRTGEGIEAESVHATSARGAGVTQDGLTERHHVLPRELKGWFQERGFPGNDIDAYCIQLDIAEHQALHGGGNFRLGNNWDGSWNRALMAKLEEAEVNAGRRLTREDVLTIVRDHMRTLEIDHLPFVPYRGPR